MASDMHVVILPWSAFGHIMPFFQFSIELAKAGIHVSFVSTPRNIQRLPKISPNLATLIHLVELPLPILNDKYGLPEGAEATVDIPAEKIQYLKIAYDQLQYPFKQFVADKMPNWIVVDLCSYWASDIAKEYGIPLLYMSVFSGAMRAFMGPPEYLAGDGQKRLRATPESLTSPPEWIDFPSSVAFRSYEARIYYPGFYGENASGIRDAERLAKTMAACQASLVRSCTEFEGEYLNIFEKLLRKPVIPLGLLPPEKPFLWALRKPSWAINDTDNVLPQEFIDRTSKKGIVCIGWAPQQRILAHPSIGGSLFHSGWGSVIETLQYGHCLIVLPFIIDQGVNARLLVEKGLAVEVDRREDGSFTRNDIDKSLRLAMVSEEGKKLRDRTKEAATIFGDAKLHQNYITRLVEYLKNGI